MAFDEFLFGKLSTYFKKKQNPELLEREICLDSIRDKLTILARAITGKAIDIFHAEREGGYKNNSFFLPSKCALFATKLENHSYYIFRILYLSVQQKLNLNWQNSDLKNDQYSSQKAFETSHEILKILFSEYPLTKEWHDEFLAYLTLCSPKEKGPDTTYLYGKWMQNTLEILDEKTLVNISDKTKTANPDQIKTTLQAKAVEDVISLEIDKKQQEDYVLTHNFEKVDTADEFSGSWRDFDGDDELEDHEQALDELNLKLTVRVDDLAHSVYQADFIENTTISESSEQDSNGYHLLYNEWDYSKKSYKDKFCKLYPITLIKKDHEYYQKTINNNATLLVSLRKMLTSLNNKMQEQRRQSSGDEFDLDALTDLYVDVKSRHTPSDNIYISKRKKEKDLSILLLLDISLSSDGYADGNRIIDVEKDVSILFGEILNEFKIDFAIDSFYSKTRNYSTYQTLKNFDEPWDKAKYSIGALEPNGYTRMGAALRHSGALLEKRSSQKKWVILISDGKPNDYDKYEGKYGINDVKQALRELHENQINAFALAIEAQAKYYLPQMFGQNHYQILTSSSELLKSMILLFEKIKYQN